MAVAGGLLSRCSGGVALLLLLLGDMTSSVVLSETLPV
jgi:hypothetical protein